MNNSTFHLGINVPEVINASGDKTCELYFTNTIQNGVNWFTGDEVSLLRDCIDKINAEKPTHICMMIDSWGGSAPVGMGLYNYIKNKDNHKAKIVSTKILNNCASIATVMALAGDKGKITMPRNGMMVIHRAMNSASGTADELREAAALADKYTDQVLDVYVQNNRKGKTKEELTALIAGGDYWMTGTEACEMGFVDECYNNESTITNSISQIKAFGYGGEIPQRILDMATAEVTPEPETTQEHKNFFSNLINQFTMKVTDIINGIKPQITAAVPASTEGQAHMETLLTNMLNAVNTGVQADIAEAATQATNAVTTAVTASETKWKGVLDALTETVTALTAKVEAQTTALATATETVTAQATTITALRADVQQIQGRPAPDANKPENNGKAATKTFASAYVNSQAVG